MTVIPVVFGPLGTVPKSIETELKETEIKGRIKIIRITALFISSRIIRSFQKGRIDLLSL